MDLFKPRYAGIDGCKAGWFYVALDELGHYQFGVEEGFHSVIERLQRAHLILVDIPIGLPGSGMPTRPCDSAARKALSPRTSSVFPVPTRSALEKSSREEASRENHRVLGKKLTIQSWCIAPKIEEVDTFMRSRYRKEVREMHPEVAFWALNNRTPLLTKKKKKPGIRERLEILSKYFPETLECYEACERAYLRKEVARDDIVDAMVGAVTASFVPNVYTLPEVPDLDSCGLPMEMVYACAL